jgi:hypothetical protein
MVKYVFESLAEIAQYFEDEARIYSTYNEPDADMHAACLRQVANIIRNSIIEDAPARGEKKAESYSHYSKHVLTPQFQVIAAWLREENHKFGCKHINYVDGELSIEAEIAP